MWFSGDFVKTEGLNNLPQSARLSCTELLQGLSSMTTCTCPSSPEAGRTAPPTTGVRIVATSSTSTPPAGGVAAHSVKKARTGARLELALPFLPRTAGSGRWSPGGRVAPQLLSTE